MSLSPSQRINFTSDTEEMWIEESDSEEELFKDPNLVYKYSSCFLYDGFGLNKSGKAHRCCESHLSETTQKVICAVSSLSLISCFATSCLTIANCYFSPIYALVNTQLIAACAASIGLSAIEASSAVFCAGGSVYCSCHHCKDQNV